MIKTIYHAKPPSGCLADYHQLAAKVRSGTHRFVNIYSPPRCGSTTVLKNSYQQIHHFHKALNEPAAQLSAGDDKESAMYRYLLNKLLSLEGEQIGSSGTLTQPFNILVKQISRHILSQALAIYVEILNDGHKLEFPGHHANFLLGHNENGMSILDIDPIFVYAHIATSKELIKQEKQKLLQNIIEASIRNSNHPNYCSYFTAINNAANPPFALEIDALAGGAARWRFMQKPVEAGVEGVNGDATQAETVAMTDAVSNEAVMAVAALNKD